MRCEWKGKPSLTHLHAELKRIVIFVVVFVDNIEMNGEKHERMRVRAGKFMSKNV